MTDEELWSRYAAAALSALIQTADDSEIDSSTAANAACYASAMLAEHRRRWPAGMADAETVRRIVTASASKLDAIRAVRAALNTSLAQAHDVVFEQWDDVKGAP